MTQDQKGHKWFASIYDSMTARAEKTFMREVREEIAGGAKGRVLEVGAGTGANFPYYSDRAEEITATEPDPHGEYHGSGQGRDAGQGSKGLDRVADRGELPERYGNPAELSDEETEWILSDLTPVPTICGAFTVVVAVAVSLAALGSASTAKTETG